MKPTTDLSRAVVTGASGFIGSHLVEHLSRAGWQVAVIARPPSASNLSKLSTISKAYTYTGKSSEVAAAIADFRPHVVFHLGSLFLAQHNGEQIEPLVASNILFGTQLLEAMRLCKVNAFINTGTAWQNYNDEAYNPVNLYAATKQAFEDILIYYVQVAGMRAITLRLFDSYGPHDTRRKLLALLTNTLKTGEPLGMSPGDQILDLTYVDDICDAFMCAAELVRDGETARHQVFAVSGGERHTLRETVEIFEQVAKRKLPITFGARPYRDREVMAPWSGPQLPGWRARVSLHEGLRRVLEAEGILG